MAVTRTEIKLGEVNIEKVDKAIGYLEKHGYSAKEFKGYETWIKPCVPIWSQLSATYHCVQVHEVGDTWIIEEWITNWYGMQMDVNGVMAILFSLGSSLLHHNNVINFLKNL